jgi:hypothetical protein
MELTRAEKIRELANEVVTRIAILAEYHVARDRLGDKHARQAHRDAAECLMKLLREVAAAARGK